MLKSGLKRKSVLMILAAVLSAAMVFPSMASTSSITSISLGLSYHISEGDTNTNVRVTSGSSKYEVSEVEVTNEPDDDGWDEGDKPKIKVTVETDEDDYKFSGVSKSDVTINGDEGTVTSVTKKSSSKLYVYITLDEVDESSSTSGNWPQGMPNNQLMQQPNQQINQQPGGQSAQTNTNNGKKGWVKDAKGWKYHNDDQSEMKNQWKSINNKWYYFDGDGYMKTGWFQQGGKWYYCNEDGEMLANTRTPDGYYVGADGAWVQ
ncbi:MAG: hypothetical protein LIO92_13115 [Clostridiales bacterium]|nr:hypothetical protein [Clostridiales bacterium]